MDNTRIQELTQLKTATKESMKGKDFKNLSSSDKDKLLEMICKLLNLID